MWGVLESLGWSELVWEGWELLLCWLLPPSGALHQGRQGSGHEAVGAHGLVTVALALSGPIGVICQDGGSPGQAIGGQGKAQLYLWL